MWIGSPFFVYRSGMIELEFEVGDTAYSYTGVGMAGRLNPCTIVHKTKLPGYGDRLFYIVEVYMVVDHLLYVMTGDQLSDSLDKPIGCYRED